MANTTLGDDDLKAQYEERSNSRPEREYCAPFIVPPYKRLQNTNHRAPQNAVMNASGNNQDVLSFLKSRPQIARLGNKNAKSAASLPFEHPRTSEGKKVDDLVNVDRYKGRSDAWQQSETIEDFLQRLPIEDPATATVGPWLWVGSPTVPFAHAQRKPEAMDGFVDDGVELLQSFDVQRGKIEGDNPGKAASTMTRKLAPHRDQLEIDLLTLAVKMGATSGKWMLFPNPSDLVRVWRIVATATADGKLGPVSKVTISPPFLQRRTNNRSAFVRSCNAMALGSAPPVLLPDLIELDIADILAICFQAGTIDPTEPNTLICIYTYDFSDFEDVCRVLNVIVDLALCHADGRPLYYKCDAYTHLNISSGNSYKLKASLYSSKEILHNDVKVREGGPVARMKKRRNKTLTDFFQVFAGDDVS